MAVCHPRLLHGGSEACALWAITALKDEYDVTLITGGPVDLERLNEYYGTALKPGDFTIRQAPIPLWLSLLRRTGKGDALDGGPYQKFCRRVATESDVLISTYGFGDFGRPAIHRIADFSWDDEIRRQFHSQPGRIHQLLYGDNRVRKGYLWLSRRMAGSSGRDFLDADGVIVSNSRWTATILKRKYGCDSIVIYPVVVADFPVVPWGEKRNEFVCIGRIDPAKRIERIIEVINAVCAKGHDVKLNIAGPVGGDAYGQKIKRLAEHRADWVILQGKVWGQAKKNLLSSCKYGIQGCAAESFGISVAEMVRAGCIPFVPNGGGQVEIVNHPLLTYDGVEDAVGRICSVLEDEKLQGDLRDHLAKQGRLFSGDHFVEGIREVVRTFLEKRR